MIKFKCVEDYNGTGWMIDEIHSVNEWVDIFLDRLVFTNDDEKYLSYVRSLNEENIEDFANDDMMISLIKIK